MLSVLFPGSSEKEQTHTNRQDCDGDSAHNAHVILFVLGLCGSIMAVLARGREHRKSFCINEDGMFGRHSRKPPPN